MDERLRLMKDIDEKKAQRKRVAIEMRRLDVEIAGMEKTLAELESMPDGITGFETKKKPKKNV